MVHNFRNYICNRFNSKRVSYKDYIGLLIKGTVRLKCKLKGKQNYENELLGSIITLKNLSLVSRNQPLSSDYILEVLMENSKKLKPIYQDVLSMYRAGYEREAFDIFGTKVGGRGGKSFASMLYKLNKINPSELVVQMNVLEEYISEQKMTLAYRKAQRNSMITTLWATVGVFALIVNFVVVVVLLETMEMLRFIF